MRLEDLTINEVQITRAKALEPPLDSPSSNPILTVRPQREISRVKAQSRACHEATPAPNALNVKVMST